MGNGNPFQYACLEDSMDGGTWWATVHGVTKSQTWLSDFTKLVLGKAEEIANIHWIMKKARDFQKNIYFCFINYTKAFDCVDHNKLWKIFKDMEISDHLSCLLRSLYAGQVTELDIKQQISSKSGKEYIKAVYCHSAYLTYMQSTSCESPGWMKQKLESRLQGEISITSDMQMTPSLWQKSKKN